MCTASSLVTPSTVTAIKYSPPRRRGGICITKRFIDPVLFDFDNYYYLDGTLTGVFPSCVR